MLRTLQDGLRDRTPYQMEVVMTELMFKKPVLVRAAEGVQEIASVREAAMFLREWPQHRRGPVYRCAVNCCQGAMDGMIGEEDARKSLEGFARISGILATAMVMPLVAASRGADMHGQAKH